MIKNKPFDYPEGSLLFDVRYIRSPESFEVIYLDPMTKRLEVKYEDPIIDIWFLNMDERNNKLQIPQIEKELLYPVYCKASQVSKTIAKEIGGEWEQFYLDNKDMLNEHDMKTEMCKCPWVFKGDFQPEAYFRLKWINQYGKECDATKTTYSFFDIEVDVLDRTIDPKQLDMAPQPINAVSIILPEQKIVVLLVLGPRPEHLLHPKFHKLLHDQEKQYEWLVNNQEEFKRMIIEDDPDNKKYIGDFKINLHLFDFNDEIQLIKTLFDYLNKYRPMFALSWNAEFDDNYTISRIRHLGYDPAEIIILPEFKSRKLYYSQDKRKEKTMKTSKDFMFSSTYYIMMCQMKNFAHIRKSQQEKRSYSLNYIGKTVAKIEKLSETKSGTFREFAYTDFIKFLLYNVRDTVVQYAIEKINNDCQSLVSRSYQFATPYSKCFEETHIVRNTREYYFEKSGYIQSCKLLIENGIDTAFKGAYVAPTEKNAPTGYVLNGKRINNIIFGAADADAAAYYPSTKMGCNLDPMSLYGKCVIDNTVFMNDGDASYYNTLIKSKTDVDPYRPRCYNYSLQQEYTWVDSKSPPQHHAEDLSANMFNAFKNDSYMSLLSNWFNVPSISMIVNLVDEKLKLK